MVQKKTIEMEQGFPLHSSGGECETTNNRMELTAVIRGLTRIKNAKLKPDPLIIRCHSKYVLKGLEFWLPLWEKRKWQTVSRQPVLNQDLWQELLRLKTGYPISYRWVRGHSGDQWNEQCDSEAVREAYEASRLLRHREAACEG